MSPAAATAATTYEDLPIGRIMPSPTNPRTFVENDRFDELVASVVAHGVLQPIVVRPLPPGLDADYEIVAGERRFRAARVAGLPTIPALVRPPMTDDEVLEIQLIENLQREDLAPLEQARGYRALLDRNPQKYTAAGIATRLGLSEKWVWDRMKLLDLIPAAQQLLAQDRMGVGHAILIARQKPTDQKHIIDPASGALFTAENALDFDDVDGKNKPGKYDALKPRSVRELDAWIAHHIRFDVEHQAQAAPLDFAPTKAAVEAAAAQPGRGRKVIQITREWTVGQDAKDEHERTYGSSAWKRADGEEGSKTCEHAVLGVIAAGPGYGQAFEVCIARDKCEVHWRSRRGRRWRQKREEAARTKRAERARTKRAERWKVFAPALSKAVFAAANAQPTLTGPLFAQLLKHYRLPATTTIARLPPAMLLVALRRVFDNAWSHDEPTMRVWAKVLKVNIQACEPKPSADAAAARKNKR